MAIARSGVLQAAPDFSNLIHGLFSDSDVIDSRKMDTAKLLEDVATQLAGAYRLAGGRCGPFAPTIEAFEDAEDIHAYHRLYWAVRYAEAAALGHHSALEALPRDLGRWLDGEYATSAVVHWPYTVAERIASLSATLFWISRCKTSALSELIPRVKAQIWQDGVQLSANVEFDLGVHNHLLNDARGLFLAGAALMGECDQAAAWREQALALWDEYFPQLVLDDGTFAEQSSHYHFLMCRTALEYWLACRLAHRAMPSGFEARIRLMFELANELLRSDGSLPRFGDNSPDRIISDLWGLLAAAHHHGLLNKAPRHSAVTPLTFFYCGNLPEQVPEALPAVSVFRNGGFAFLRSAEIKAELTAHGDGRKGVGAHGDSGRGSYELWWDGNVLVREPGSFFSGSNANWRFYQGAEAQNVTSLDGLSPAISKQDERFVAGWYRPQGGNWRVSAENGLEFRCDAFQRIRADITLVRTWRFVEPDTLVFEEAISGNDRVKFESRICLSDAAWTFTKSDDAGDTGRLRWCGTDGSTVDMTVRMPPELTLTIHPCTFLPEYGVETKGRTLVLSGERKLPCVWNVRWKFRKAS